MADAPKRKRSPLFWVIVALAAVGCAVFGAAVLFVVATPKIAEAVERAERSLCEKDLREVYQQLIQYQTAYGGDAALAMQTWWDGQGELERSHPSFAWRDMQRFPLERFPGSEREPLAACGAERHAPDVVHVLRTDGSIDALTLAGLKAEGVVPADADVVRIGPDSPVSELRKLTRD